MVDLSVAHYDTLSAHVVQAEVYIYSSRRRRCERLGHLRFLRQDGAHINGLAICINGEGPFDFHFCKGQDQSCQPKKSSAREKLVL